MTLFPGVLIASCALPALLAIVSLIRRPNHKACAVALLAFGIICLSVAGSTWRQTVLWQAPDWLAIGMVPVQLTGDPLSAFFMLLLATVCICCAIYSPDYLEHLKDRISHRFYWSALFAFVGGMAGVLLAGNAVVFIVAWEVMSIASALLVLSDFRQQRAQKAAINYLVATRVATAFISLGFLLMYVRFADWSFSAWNFSDKSSWPAAAFLMIGFIIKAGIWPFHIWLPYAHPEAPSPVSSLMSGVMVKVAVYAALRFFVVGQLSCQPLVYAVFALASVSAFWGILFAINQRELKRLLAYSTVENIGLIFLGLSLSLWARNVGLDDLACVALLGTLLHCFAHGLFKSLLFLSAGCVDYSAHSRDLTLLGGLSKRMPLTTAFFVLGSSANCAIPPLNGFVSKWYLYQSLLRSAYTLPTLCDRAVCLAAIGVLSAVGALAVACFAKAIGVAFLGKARTSQSGNAKEVPPSMTLAQLLLASACLVTGIGASGLLPFLSPVLTYSRSVVLQTDVLASLPLCQFAISFAVLMAAIFALLLRNRPFKYKTWDCGFGSLSTKTQATADSFAQPIARIFTPVLHHSLTVDISGRDRRHFPEKISVEPSIVSLLETRFYGPAAYGLGKLSQSMAKLQAGSIHLYLLYVCIALVILMLVGTAIW